MAKRVAGELGKVTAAIDAGGRFGERADRRTVHHPVRERREAGADLRQRAGGAERARRQRRAVTRPVVGEELALEARDVDADRALRLAGAALEAQIEHVVDALVAET